MTKSAVIAPPGKYIAGDPCYCFGNDTKSWDLLCDEGLSMERGAKLLTSLGRPVVWVSTAYGDGLYADQYGHEYGVDAGLLGLVPFELVEEGCSYLQWAAEHGENNQCGRVVEFDVPVECSYDNGVVRLGNLTIETGDSEAEDE